MLITSVAYSQQDIVMTVDDVLEKEMVDMDKVFYIIVDSTLYPLTHIKDDEYRIPKSIIDRISEVDTFYFYLETNKGYYWSNNNDQKFLSDISKVSFLGLSKKGCYRYANIFITPYFFIPIRYKVNVASIRYYYRGSSLSSCSLTNYQKKQ